MLGGNARGFNRVEQVADLVSAGQHGKVGIVHFGLGRQHCVHVVEAVLVDGVVCHEPKAARVEWFMTCLPDFDKVALNPQKRFIMSRTFSTVIVS